MKIVVDVCGGDYSPQETVAGAVLALEQRSDLHLVLCGKKEEILPLLPRSSEGRYTVVHAPDVITNDDDAVSAVRNRRDSSLVQAFFTLNQDSEAQGLVSTGSTGAVLTAAVLLTKRIQGINRPALCPILPTAISGKSAFLIDCGANSDPKALNLVQFGQMGAAYAKVLGVSDPTISLLSNGTEDKKGNALNKEAFPLMKESNFHFVGNSEARDLLTGKADVYVADGFSGNIALKACEGTAVTMFSLIKDGIMHGGLRAKLGYLLLKPVFKGIKKTMDYNDNGGAVLLGLQKVVVKGHGASKRKAVANAILQCADLAEKRLPEAIGEALHD